eukprot:s472_g19.t3
MQRTDRLESEDENAFRMLVAGVRARTGALSGRESGDTARATCCTTATEPANETREDEWAVHRDERLKSSTPRPSQAYLSAAALQPLSARPSLVVGDQFGGFRYSSISDSTVGPCTPKMVHSRPALEDQDGVSSTSNLSDFRLGQLSPRSGMSEADGTASNSTETMSLRLSVKASLREHRMSASELLKQASEEPPKQARRSTNGSPRQGQPDGHSIDSTAVSQVLAEIRKQDTTPKSDPARSSKVRSARSSSSSQLKARSRSSSSVSHGKRSSSSARKGSARSPSSRSRLDKHLEVSKDDSGPSMQARRSNRATTEQAAPSETMVPNTEARHRTWSGPEPQESKAKEKGLITEALSPSSDGSTANTKGSRDSTAGTASPSRSTLSGRLLGGSRNAPSENSLSRSPSERETAVILVDWDDTLCPTSWVFEQIRKCPDNKALAAVERASADLLEEHSKTVVAFLRAARACAQVAVVTLATEDFFHQSADTFLHEVRVRDLFGELGIEVHFAARPAQVSFPAEIDAKRKSSMGCARSTRSADTYAPEVAEVAVSARLTGSSRGSRAAKATATATAGNGQGSKAKEEEATERRRGLRGEPVLNMFCNLLDPLAKSRAMTLSRELAETRIEASPSLTIHLQQLDWGQSTSSAVRDFPHQHGKQPQRAFAFCFRASLRKPRVDCWRGDRKPLVRDDEAAPGAPGAPSAPAAQRPQSVAAPRKTGADAPRSGAPATALSVTPQPGTGRGSTPVAPARRSSTSVPAPKKDPNPAKRSSKGKGKGEKGLPAKAIDLDEHEKALLNEVLDASPGVSWDAIAGLEEVKRLFWEIVVAPVKNPLLFSGVRSPPRGVLLFGPPGNGKTMLAKAVASEARQPPDEIDSMLTSRSSGEHEAARRLKTEFLVQLDGVGTSDSTRILLLGATNRPGELDDAVLRRLPRRILIPLPDGATRGQLVSKELQGTRHSLSPADFTRLASMTDGYSCSDLAALTREAAMGPVRNLRPEALVSATPEGVRAITLADFREAIQKAMSQCLSKVYAGRHLTRWNVLSVGDSEIELEALKSLLGSKWRSPLCKTVKFDARPTLTQLTAQLKSVTPNLAASSHDGMQQELPHYQPQQVALRGQPGSFSPMKPGRLDFIGWAIKVLLSTN